MKAGRDFDGFARLRGSRRGVLGAMAALATLGTPARSQESSELMFQLPMGLPGMVPGDGCYIRHGYACENTGFNTGWWHTGENWYTVEGNSAGALIYAVAAGEVVYADADYPGRVVIIRHSDDLYSMYGHLDYALEVTVGDVVERGTTIGTVLYRTDTRSPSHLHFELRSFLLDPVINGAAPRYDFACGVNCPPGPGYWPMNDPDHPSDLGWMNPMHVIARRITGNEPIAGLEVVTAISAAPETEIWAKAEGGNGEEPLSRLATKPGDRFPLLAVSAGPERSRGTSAEAYDVWFEIETPSGTGRVQQFLPDWGETGIDGRPSALQMQFIVVPRL